MAEVGDITVHDVHTVEAGFDDFSDKKNPFVAVSLRMDFLTAQYYRIALIFPADRRGFAAKLAAAINAVRAEDERLLEEQSATKPRAREDA